MSVQSSQAAWELWHSGYKELGALGLARAFAFAAGRGWARGELILSVSLEERDANNVLRSRVLFLELTHAVPSELTADEVSEVRAAVAMAPSSWRERVQHSTLMINLSSSRPD
ncbi:hypothetical protein TSA6c_25505 [Azospirillum sp. TSA6c]|uniref:hypothetical protein n=1 Tax=Azospirillum sp. TSA6c TaxID=709813 RepID=UPI000D61A327|nr:hypothetical protein [Azospirillum sp. TSA6c]PWC49497.1 hypothetical protein TSA6c_25505 [Azospirillum sp. TSA6c]